MLATQLTYRYIYIIWTVFANVTTKSAQHGHARMIAIIVRKSPNLSHLYDHGFMDVIPIVRESKIDFIHKQVIRLLFHGGSHFDVIQMVRQSKIDFIQQQVICPLINGGSHFEISKWLPPWNKGRITCLWIRSIFDCLTIGIKSMKPCSYKWLEFGLLAITLHIYTYQSQVFFQFTKPLLKPKSHIG